MTELQNPPTPEAGRRGVLIGAGALGAGVVLTACGGGASAPAASQSSAQPAEATPSEVQVQVADVAVGGGVVLKDVKVVVTQPQAGQFHAFSAVCPHKQCVVSEVTDGAIVCPCHGSRFDAADGAVIKGPAKEPLAAKTVTVAGDSLTIS